MNLDRYWNLDRHGFKIMIKEGAVTFLNKKILTEI